MLKEIYACFDDLGKGLDVPLCQQQCQRELALLARLQDSLCSLTAACWDIHKSRYTLSSTAVGADSYCGQGTSSASVAATVSESAVAARQAADLPFQSHVCLLGYTQEQIHTFVNCGRGRQMGVL